MSVFDRWMQENHPEILIEFSRRPKAQRYVTLWHWMLRKHKYVVVVEWLHAARQLSRS